MTEVEVIDATAQDRFIRKGNALYRPGRIEQARKDGHGKDWAVAYYIISEDDEWLLCNFVSRHFKPKLKISKGLII